MSDRPDATRRRTARALLHLLVLAAVLVGIRAAVQRPHAAHGQAPPVAMGGAEAAPAERPPAVITEADIEAIEDPRILYRSARIHLRDGDRELARACFRAGLLREELGHYFRLEEKHATTALVHEWMGEHDEAEQAWQQAVEQDLQQSYILCRLFGRAPDRDRRLEDMRAELRRRVDAVQRGEIVHWYTTRSGTSRTLTAIDQDELVARARESSKSVKYVYLPELDLAALPPDLDVTLFRSVVGSLKGYQAERSGRFGMSGFVLDEFHLGKYWLGPVNKSKALPPARLGDTLLTELVVLPDAQLAGVVFDGRNAMFPFCVFEGAADFSAIQVSRNADFRYATFTRGATFRRASLDGPVHFGHARFEGPADFGAVVAVSRRAHFNSVICAGPALFEATDLRQGATFEDARFDAGLELSRSRFGARANLSRARIVGELRARELVADGFDLFGVTIDGDSDFTDSVFDGHVRFSLDEVTHRDFAGRVDDLHKLYKLYQGDEDATEPLTTRSAYGVESVDDLTARILGDVAFANVMFLEFCQFQRVSFGRAGEPGTASFYNAQFRGETHFERAQFFADADFTTIFANELGLNEAVIHRRLMLDDANVPGRVTLTGARFVGDADLSLYGAQISRFHISKDQLVERRGRHRLFYERCARGRVDDVENDPRIQRAFAGRGADERPEVVDLCYERLVEDFNVLNNAFGERGMPKDEDWAYWYGSHHDTMHTLLHGTLGERGRALVRWFLFELMFGWGVKLQNLGFAVLIVVFIYGLLYKWLTPDAHIEFNGFQTTFRQLSYPQAMFISMLSLMSMDIGWDIGRNRGFRWLNVSEVLLGIIILTFFVGAYTRLVLA